MHGDANESIMGDYRRSGRPDHVYKSVMNESSRAPLCASFAGGHSEGVAVGGTRSHICRRRRTECGTPNTAYFPADDAADAEVGGR